MICCQEATLPVNDALCVKKLQRTYYLTCIKSEKVETYLTFSVM